MRTFFAALLAATALAQANNSTNTTYIKDMIKQAVAEVTNWLLGKTKDNLRTDS
jgi:hypothetical protein